MVSFQNGFLKQAIAGKTYVRALTNRALRAGGTVAASKVQGMSKAVVQFGAQHGTGGKKARSLLAAGRKVKEVTAAVEIKNLSPKFLHKIYKNKVGNTVAGIDTSMEQPANNLVSGLGERYA